MSGMKKERALLSLCAGLAMEAGEGGTAVKLDLAEDICGEDLFC
jgi:hypothetical protein